MPLRMDGEATAFLELVKRKQRAIVLKVAAEQRGRPCAEVEEVLRRRLAGTGVQPCELARWADAISKLPGTETAPGI